MILYTQKWKVPFQIDEADFEAVSYYSWSMTHGYPRTVTSRLNTGKRDFLLHHFLMGQVTPGFEWDHRNRDRADNRRENLRLVTIQINRRNSSLRSVNISGVKGVTWSKRDQNWVVQIVLSPGNTKHVCSSKDLDIAIAARKKAEELYWGSNR